MQMTSWTREGVPHTFGKELYPGDLERLAPHLEVAMEAFPCFANAEIQSVVNGPITYTPDILPMVGPTLLPNMWLAVGELIRNSVFDIFSTKQFTIQSSI